VQVIDVGMPSTIFSPRFALAALLLPALALAAPARAGQTVGVSQAAIVEPLSLINTADLEFGAIASNGAAGTVTVSPLGVRTATGGAILAGGTFHPAEFSGFGRRNQQIRIAFGAPSILVTRAGGTQTMVVDNFTLNSPPSGSLANLGGPTGRYRISSTTGVFDFPIGARLNVAANQAQGNYVGSFTVTVTYQ
jgi:spore coat protein U-like protein